MSSTITFSGLASGLDTSAWIESLVSVKQTTVTSLEEAQKVQQELLSVVNNIKSFFTSFQTCLQKITDSQFGISSMDLFLQNLATSSNTNIATATATTEAARQSYDVLVDQLATSTKATSGVKDTQTQFATLNTKLGQLGVQAGTIQVNSNSFNITEDDTIKTLIEKFSKVGVVASFNEKKSTFTVNVELSKINDGATGLKSALKLQDKTIQGGTSGSIVYATKNTMLYRLGLKGGDVTIEGETHTIVKNDTSYTIQKAGDASSTRIDTIEDFLNYLKGSSVNAEEASIDDKGNITIKGAVIESIAGGSNIKDVLNLGEVTDRTVMESNNLTYQAGHAADLSTTLNEIGIVGETTLDIDGVVSQIADTSTLESIKNILEQSGITMGIDSNGVITIDTNGKVIGGTLIDALGLEVSDTGTSLTSEAHKVTKGATGNTLLSELGITDTMKYTAYTQDGVEIAGAVDISNNSGLTIDEFVEQLKNQGLNASFNADTQQLIIEDGYITGDLAVALGMASNTISTQVSATGSTTLEELGAVGDQTLTINDGAEKVYDKTTTLDTIIQDIETAGGRVNFVDGMITISGVSLSGTLTGLLGFEATTQGTTVTSGAISIVTDSSSTSSGGVVDNTLDLTTTVGEITGSTNNYTLTVNNNTTTLTKDSTLQDISDVITGAGGTFTLNADHTVTIDGVTLEGSIVSALGFASVVNGSQISSNNPIVIGETLQVDGNTTFDELNVGADKRGYAIYASDGSVIKTTSTDGTSGTISDWLSEVNSVMNSYYSTSGVTYARVENGIIKIDQGYAAGDLFESLGITTESDYSVEISSGKLGYVENRFISEIEYQDTSGGQRVSAVSSFTSGGKYLISDASDLNKLSELVNAGNSTEGATFILTNDIDMSSVANFTPIGYYNSDSDYKAFKGNLYGNGHVISNLTINAPDKDSVGLFGRIEGPTSSNLTTIRDIGLENVNITGKDGVGGFAAATAYTTITNCYTTGNIETTGTNESIGANGGLIGMLVGAVQDCYSTVDIVSTSNGIGGLVGFNYFGSIESSYASGSVTGNEYVGGLVGSNGGNISYSYATGLVSGTTNVGGLIGEQANISNITITNSYYSTSTGQSIGIGHDGQNNPAQVNITQATTEQILANGTLPACREEIDAQSSTTLDKLGIGNNSTLRIISNGQTQTHTFSSTDTIQDVIDYLNGISGVTATFANSEINITSTNPDIAIRGDVAEALNITNTAPTTGVSISGDRLTLSTSGEFIDEIEYKSAPSGAQKVNDVTSFSSGSTYLISDVNDLKKLAELVNGGQDTTGVTFILTNDIDMSGVNDYVPIGTYSNSFKGSLYGNGHVISNLTINTPTQDYVGLFGYIESRNENNIPLIRDIGLENVNITGKDYVGGLGGRISGNIYNSYVTGTITGINSVGGFTGESVGVIENLYSSGTVIGNGEFTGGLVGSANSIIDNSFSSSNVSGNIRVGGLVGIALYTPVNNSYATGNVSGTDYVGGFIGESASYSLTNSYSTGVVTGSTNVGGFAGASLMALNCYYSTNSGQSVGTGQDQSGIGGITQASTADIMANNSLSHFTPTNNIAYNDNSSLGVLGLVSSGDRDLSISINGSIKNKTFSESDSIQDIVDYLNTIDGINANYTDGTLSILSEDRNIVISGGIADKFGIGTSGSGVNDGVTISGSSILVSRNTSSQSTPTGVEKVSNVTSFTSGSTYLVSDSSDLVKLAELVNGGQDTTNVKFIMTNDIDMSGVSSFTPIGDGATDSSIFKGEFDGNGYVISNLTINLPDQDNVGLFGGAGATSVLKNIRLIDVNITGKDYVGGLVGTSMGSIDNSYVTGTVTGSNASNGAGGLVGAIMGNISNSYSSATVIANGTAGGLTGILMGGTITHSYATGAVTATDCAGGLAAGSMGSISNSYATGAVSVTSSGGVAAGLVGINYTSITNSYYTDSTNQSTGVGQSIWGSTTVEKVSNSFIENNPLLPHFIQDKTSVYNTDTTISGLGLKTAEDRTINVNIDGSTHTKTFEETDTLQDVLDYLGTLGLDAEFKNSAVSISSDSATSVNISGELGLTILGYKYDRTTSNVDKELSITSATGTLDTTTEIGALLGNSSGGSITVNVDGAEETFTYSSTDTVQDVIDDLTSKGITAEVVGGVFNAQTTGNTTLSGDIFTALLGSTGSISYSSEYNSEDLLAKKLTSNSDTVEETTPHDISLTTKIGDITGSTNNYTLVVDGTTVNLTKDSTLQDVSNAITSAGGRFIINDDNTITIEGVNLGGTLTSALGLASVGEKTEMTSNTAIMVGGTEKFITVDNTLSDLGAVGNQTLVINGSSKIYSANTSLESIFNDITLAGGTAEIRNGIVHITGVSVSGGIADLLHLSQIGTLPSTPVSESTKLGSISSGLSEYKLTINGVEKTYNSNTTLGSIKSDIQNVGGTMSIDSNGKIRIEGVSLSGNVKDILGLTATSMGTEISSNNPIVVGSTVTVTGSNTFTELGVASGDRNYAIYASDGSVIKTTSTDGTSGTISDWLSEVNSAMNSYYSTTGVNYARIENGVIKIDKGYAAGDLLDSLGISTSSSVEVTISSGKLEYTKKFITDIDYQLIPADAQRVSDVTTFEEGKTYLITDANDLNKLAELVNAGNSGEGATFILANDIDMSSVANFTPIGNNTNQFKGSLYGNGHVISNLTINLPDQDYVGLFGYTGSSSIIKDVGLENINITGQNNIGGLTGYASSSSIVNSYTSGIISGNNSVGGLVGGTSGSVLNSYSEVIVKGAAGVGGLVGVSYGNISDSYSTGSVTGSSLFVGGLLGNGNSSTSIANSYSLAKVTGTTYVGGLAGSVSNITNSYYSTSTGQSNGVGNGTATGVTQATTEEILANSSLPHANMVMDAETSTKLDKLGISSNADLKININGQTQTHTFTSADTIQDVVDFLNGISGITATFEDSELRVSSTDTNISITGDFADKFNLTTYKPTTGVSISGDRLEFESFGEFIGEIDYHAAPPGAQKVYDVSSFSSGSTYLISDISDLNKLADLVNSGKSTSGAIFVLTNDINMSSVSNFEPIGKDSSKQFAGKFYGNGYVISNLKINRSTTEHIGLFGYTSSSATIKDLGLEGVNITGKNNTGGLVGRNNAIIENCYVTGSITGNNYTGGVIGSNSKTVTNCYSNTTVTGVNNVGGLIGESYNGDISNSYSKGSASGNMYIGGFIGSFSGGSIQKTYSDVAISGTSNVGGYAGYRYDQLTISDSYTTNSILVGMGSSTGIAFASLSTIQSNQVLPKSSKKMIGHLNTATFDDLNLTSSSNRTINININGANSTKTFESTNTIQDVVDYLNSIDGIYAEFENSTLSLLSNDKNITISGGLADELGIATTGNNSGVVVSGSTILVSKPTQETQESDFVSDIDTQDTSGAQKVSEVSSFSSGGKYIITDASDLNKLAELVNDGQDTTGAIFILGNDIDMSGVSNFTPIGSSYSNSFKGSFYGNGHVISNLTINLPDKSCVGLFGYTYSGAIIQDVGLENVNITGETYVGGLVGRGSSTITNSYATGSVTGSSGYIGGLVGYSYSTITNSYATGSVTGTSFVGGLVGYGDSTITNSYATGSVTGTSFVGGLEGYSYSTITNSYATGDITGTSDVGGLVGYGSSSTITNSYAKGDVSGTSDVGGLVGYVHSSYSTITNSYATGNVMGTDYVGGLVGYGSGSISNSYTIGNVEGTGFIGGLVGKISGGDINNTYATGNINGYSSIGGLVGQSTSSNITKSYATGNVTGGGANIGGLVGEANNTSSITNSYFSATTGQSVGVGSGTQYGVAMATEESIVNNPLLLHTQTNKTIISSAGTSMNDLGLITDGDRTISVNIDGSVQTHTFGADETIQDVLDYLGTLGLTAKFENSRVTVSSDTASTLEISGNVGRTILGYNPNRIETETVNNDKTLTISNEETLSNTTTIGNLLGSSSNGNLTVEINGVQHTFSYSSTDTVQDVIDDLASKGITATISNGVFNISSNQLVNITGNIAEKLVGDSGSIVSNAEYESRNLYENATPATESTKLGEINNSVSNYKLTINGVEKTYNSNTTLGSIKSDIQNAGGTMSIDSNGKITIEGVSLSGNVAEILGLSAINSGTEMSSNSSITVGEKLNASGSTSFDTLGVSSANRGYAIYASDGSVIKTTSTDGTSGTISDWLSEVNSAMNSYYSTTGVNYARIENGVIKIDKGYAAGDLLDSLGISTSSSVEVTISSGKLGYKSGEFISSIDYQSIPTDAQKVSEVSTFESGKTYLIKDASDLNKLTELVNSGQDTTDTTFILANNIDMSGISNFTPIGNSFMNSFKGSFYGNGHVISNLTINLPDKDYVGLFGYSNGLIKDIGLENINITGKNYVGGLVGNSTSSSQNTNSYVTGNLVGNGNNIGGVIGYSAGSIDSLYSTASVSGINSVGGVVGYITASISNSYSSGNVTSTGRGIGGLAGEAYDSISNCYATGSVTGSNLAGGLVGSAKTSPVITNSYYSTSTNQSRGIGNSTGVDIIQLSTEEILADNSLPHNNIIGEDNTQTSTTLDKLGISSNSDLKININGSTQTHTFTSADTIQDVVDFLNGISGITATFEDSELRVSSTDTNISITGDFADKFNLTTYKPTTGVSISGGQLEYVKTRFIDNIDYQTPPEDAKKLSSVSYVSSGSTYLISDSNDLVKLASFVNSCMDTSNVTFVLTNDIDMSGKTIDSIGKSTSTIFKGKFYGNGHLISNLTIDTPSKDNLGLFGYIQGATIKDIALENVFIRGENSVGGLVGYDAGSSTITNVYVTGSVIGTVASIGGLAGAIHSSTTISNCYTTTYVNGSSSVGGLVGYSDASISNSYANGNVSCYVSNAGGLIGYAASSSSVNSSYATGKVSGQLYVGGLIGVNSGSVYSSYYSGAIVSNGGSSSGGSGGSSSGGSGGSSSGIGVGSGSSSGITRTTTEQIIANQSLPHNNVITMAPAFATVTIAQMELGSNTDLSINLNGQNYSKTFGSTNTIQDIINYLNSIDGIYAEFENSTLSLLSNDKNITISGGLADELGIATTGNNSGVTISGSTILVSKPTQETQQGDFISDIDTQDTSGAQKVSEVSSFSSGGKYLISDANDLTKLAELVNDGQDTTGAIFILGNDIDMSGVSNFTPIGYYNSFSDRNGFKGSFYGNGHVISNLTINLPDQNYVGLFGYVDSGAVIQDIGLENGNITGRENVGGLVGRTSSSITNSYATVNITSTSTNTYSYVGGLIGDSSDSIINSYATGKVTSSGGYVGGLVGYGSGNITNSFATGNVTGTEKVGGLVGTYSYSTLTNSYATGYIIGNTNIGGLVGYTSGDITNSYATGNISGTDYIGGLVGYGSGSISNSYTIGNVEGTGFIGGLVGKISGGDINNTYATGNINGYSSIGGLVGQSTSSNITKSYATGNVTGGGANIGGLVGEANNTSSITNSYFSDTTGQSVGVGSGLSSGVVIATEESILNNPLLLHTQTNKTIISSAGTSMNDLGLITDGDRTISVNIDGSVQTHTFGADETIQDVLDYLGTLGLTATFENSRVTVSSDTASTLEISGNVGRTILGYNPNRIETEIVNNDKTLTISNEETLSNTTTIGNLLGSSSNGNLTVEINGVQHTFSYSSTDTVQDVIDDLASKGITATISNGVFNLSADKMVNISGDIADSLLGNNPSISQEFKYESGYITVGSGSGAGNEYQSSQPIKVTSTYQPLSENSTVEELLGTTQDGTLRITIDGSQIISLEYKSYDTVDTIISDLASLGINAEISPDGVFSASSDTKKFSFSGNIGRALQGDNPTYTNTDNEYNSNDLGYQKTSPITEDSILKNFGVNSGKIYILDSDGDMLNSIQIDNNMTLQQAKSTLAAYGFNLNLDAPGVVTISSDKGYKLVDGDSNLISQLKLKDWTQTEEVLTVDTTLAQMGFQNGETLNILIDGNTPMNISFGANDTVQDIINALQALEINATVSPDGVFTADSAKHTFVFSGDLGKFLTQGNTGYIISDKEYSTSDQLIVSTEKLTNESNKLESSKNLSADDTLKDMGFENGGILRLIVDNNTPFTISFYESDTMQDIIDTLATFGIQATIDTDGKINLSSVNHNFTLGGDIGNYLTKGGVYDNIDSQYTSDPLQFSTDENINLNTKLSELGVDAGSLNIIKDGNLLSNNIQIDENTTVGQLFNALKIYNIQGSIITDDAGNTAIQIYADGNTVLADGTSNFVSHIGLTPTPQGDYKGQVTYWDADATGGILQKDTILTSLDKDGKTAVGSIIFELGTGDEATEHIINITDTDTIETLLEKFQNEGVNAVLDNGVIKIDNSIDGITFTGGTSGIIDTLGIKMGDIATYATSSSAVTYEEEVISSVANYADGKTKLDVVNVTDGTLSVYVDGVKTTININKSNTFKDLFTQIVSEVGNTTGVTINAGFLDKDGNIKIDPTEDENTGIIAIEAVGDHSIVIGASNDTSNFATIANLKQENTSLIKGSRALYKVNVNSVITDSDLFKKGDITEGSFTIGDATFNITSTTTLNDLIKQINTSDKSYATAYWDTLSGTLVLQSTLTGESLINIESGTSNFTDIMGFTKVVNGTETLVTENQELGKNALVRINGTLVTSTSNTITSDISKIKGLTINLKGLSNGDSTTITVEQDDENIYNAVSDIVDAYNSLMEELEKEVQGEDGSLTNDTMLKMLKNSIKRLMTQTVGGTTVFKNLDAIGISTGEAKDSISTDVTALVIDKDKFMDALEEDSDAVKQLLVGTKTNPGTFLSVGKIIDGALQTSGYIQTTENRINKNINNLDDKIRKANLELSRYRERLEQRFGNMELIISNLQNSYSSFLNG